MQLLLAHVLIKEKRPIEALAQVNACLEQKPTDSANRSVAMEMRIALLKLLYRDPVSANP
jgi:hypothetical protein